MKHDEEFYRTLFEVTGTGFVALDGEGKVIEANEEYVRLTGHADLSKIIGRSVLEWTVERDKEYNLNALKQCREQGKVNNLEIEYACPDGRIVSVEVNATLFHQEGAAPLILGLCRDATESRKKDTALKEETARRRILFEQSPDGILIIDPPTARFLEFNTAAHQQLGYSREEFERLSIADVEVIETFEETRQHIAKVIKEGKADFDTLQRTKTGERRNVHVTAQIMEIMGKPAYVCTWRDITARKQTEAALLVSEERFRNVVESSPTAMYFYRLEADGRLILTGANESADRIIGIKHQPLIGKTIEEAFPNLMPTEVPAMYRKVAKGETGPQSFEIPYQDERFRGYYQVHVFRTGTQTIAVDFTDISDRRRVEEALREKTALLESQMEADLDALIVVDAHQQRILANQRFFALFKVPDHIAQDKDDNALSQYVVEKTKYPRQFLEKVQYLYAHPDQTSRDEIEFKDGMILDRYSSPVVDKSGKYCGRIWSFRDITENKKTEARLREKLQELETFNRFAVDRELKMIELKEQIVKLEEKLQARAL